MVGSGEQVRLALGCEEVKWAARVRIREGGPSDPKMKKSLHGYLWPLRLAGALWEWRQL